MLDWNLIAQKASAFVTAAVPFVDGAVAVFLPEDAAAVAVGEKIIQGVFDEVPEATAIYNQISSGTPPTPEQLQAFEASYETDYQKTKADIAAQIAAKGG